MDGRTFDSVLTVTYRSTKMVHFIHTWKQASAVDTSGQFRSHVVIPWVATAHHQ